MIGLEYQERIKANDRLNEIIRKATKSTTSTSRGANKSSKTTS